MADDKLRLEDLLGDVKKNDEGDRIDYVAIIGAGVMGQGIARTISQAGLDVLLVEKDEKHLEKAKAKIEAGMKYEISRWAMTDSEMKSTLSRIEWTSDISKISECDLIIEAVDENFELKKKMFEKMNELSKPDTILVSNTSTLSLTKIAESIERKDRVIGVHFLNPVPKTAVVEVVKAFETSEKTVQIIKHFAARIGKTPVEVFEYPGFITTRAIVPLLNEAMHIYLEGVASAKDIDTAMKLGYDLKIGPLELADGMGLDEVLMWMEQLWQTLGEARYRPCPILRKLVRERKLGKKTNEGFFKYDPDGKIIS